MNNVSNYKKHVELDIDINIALSNSTAYISSFFYFWSDSIFVFFACLLASIHFSFVLCLFSFFLLLLHDNGIDDKQEHVKELQDTLHPLDIARQKYFFTDDATPSYRILPDHDDCGNQITEPELWRPLEMNSEDYNAQIEVIVSP